MVTQVNVNDVYTNLSGLNSIKAAGREDASQGLRQVAKQFEGLFVNMMLKTMRDSNKAFSEGNYLSSNEMQIHQQNFDNQLSVHLTAGEGIGLADVLYRQLMQQYEVSEDTSSEKVSRASFKSPEDFVQQLRPFAESAGKELGIDPEFLIAQSALESGWGSKMATDSRGAPSNNLFGIKADSSWNGPVASAKTLEFEGGVAVQQRANFRKYDNVAESFTDYVSFLKSNPRYQSALSQGEDATRFAEALQKAGYATDPKYAEKIGAVINSSAIQTKLDRDKKT